MGNIIRRIIPRLRFYFSLNGDQLARTNSTHRARDQSTVAQRAETTVKYVQYFSSKLLTFSRLDEGGLDGEGSVPLVFRILDSQNTEVQNLAVVIVGTELTIEITLEDNEGECYIIYISFC